MAQGYDRGDLSKHFERTTTAEAGSGVSLNDADTGGAHVMASWGIEGKFPWLSYYATLQDEHNWGVHRPAQTKMLPRNENTVASSVYTPYIYGMPWQPNPPHRTKQVSRLGGEQPNQLGMQQLQALQYQMRAYPALMAQARNFFFGGGN